MLSNLIFSKLQQLLQKRAEQSASMEALVGEEKDIYLLNFVFYIK